MDPLVVAKKRGGGSSTMGLFKHVDTKSGEGRGGLKISGSSYEYCTLQIG
jgi:hypothetical protein